MANPYNDRGDSTPAGEDAFLERAASWAVDLTYDDIPQEVRRAATAQLASTVGAAIWTLTHPVGESVVRSVDREFAVGGDNRRTSTFLPAGTTTPRAACYGHAALSMAMDFDDTVLGGHTGHSAALVPLAYAEARGVSGEEALTAFVAANEVAARLAAAAAIGPFRGQQTAYVHAVGAAAGRALVEDDDASTLADALALALGQPPWPLDGAFLGSDAKVFTAAEPVSTGVAAVAHAREGLRGNTQLIEGDGGFLATFADYPLPEFLRGLGDRWHTRAVTVKPYPGCAYVTGPVHAALAIREELVDKTAGSSFDIASVDVYGSLFTSRVDALARPYVRGPDSPLSALNFSIPYNVAVALIDGEHTPRQFHPERLNDDRTWTLADRVTVQHDPDLTLRALESDVPVGAMLRRVGWRVLPYAAKTVGIEHTIRDLPTLLRFVRKRPLPESFDGADKAMGARVRVECADGTTVATTCEHPPGFAGHPLQDIERLAHLKLDEALIGAGGSGPPDDEAAHPDAGDRAAATDAIFGLADHDSVDLAPIADYLEGWR